MTIENNDFVGLIPLKPENSHFTDGQWQSIYDAGDNILVSASAGSGKTTVLVQRVIEKIKAGQNVDELLIVTYTEAAAKEMKGRIQEAIQMAITTESNQELKNHLTSQLILIPTAHISTLHAFCLQVIRKYYYLINIDPVFRMLTDETEMILLKEEVWDELRTELYDKESLHFYRLTEMFSNDRSDEGLTRTIFALYDFARANPNPNAWLGSLADAYQTTDKLADVPIYQEVLKKQLIRETEQLLTAGKEVVRLAEGEPAFEKAYQVVASELPSYENLLELVSNDELEAVYQLINHDFLSARYPSLRNLDPLEKEQNKAIQEIRKNNKKIIENWSKGLFSLPPEKMLQVMADAQEVVSYMGEVAGLFETAYSQRKESLNLLDFNDLEHYTLKILATINDNGDWEGTEASNYYRHLFKEVLVDEYQDINQLQESILFWLRQPIEGAGNFFMVGDVKQSIYSFRLADPTLFIEKYNQFEEKSGGRRIILAENFRSRSDVLDFTNLVFQQLMDNQLGQLAYDKPAQLINGFKGFPEHNQVAPELLIFESEEEETADFEDVGDDFEISTKTEGELRLVGQKIKELFDTDYQIFDKKTKESRTINYSDIVLLSPTKKNNLVLLEIFKEMDIPLEVNDTQNYFQATEIKIMMSLLKIIDNPYQDIPLAAVLRSPIVGLKENDLAFIRSQAIDASFYEGFKASLLVAEDRHNQALLEKLHTFNQLLRQWRQMARRKELITLIWSIYEETGFLDYVGGMSSGKQRQANLHALYQRAASYEEMSFKGLFQFVRFIEKMADKDKDLAEPTDLSEQREAVRVMTIHGSKGLEFPVVFVLDLTHQFNLMDLKQPYIFDVGLGAGIKYTDTAERLNYLTLPYLAIRERKRNRLLSEEMRKLYVALTRAEEKLFLVGSYKNRDAAFKKWGIGAEETTMVLSESTRLKGRSLMDWVGMTLMRHPRMNQFENSIPIAKLAELMTHPGDFAVYFYNTTDLKKWQDEIVENRPVPEKVTVTERVSQLDKEALAFAKEQLAFNYPDVVATKTASYQSVSEIKRVFEDPDNVDLMTLDLSDQAPKLVNRYVDDGLAKPAFLAQEEAVNYADIGSGTHLLLQMISLEIPPTIDSLSIQRQTLIDKGLLSESVAKKINLEKLSRFFQSDFGKQLLVNAAYVKREAPFSLLLKASDIYLNYPEYSDDTLLIHGIIDGYIETENELILYDFKTDYIGDQKKIPEIKRKYSGQLHLYRQALEAAKNRPVTGVKLILLDINEVLDFI